MNDKAKLAALIIPVGVLLSVKKKDLKRKIFEYREIKVTLTKWKDEGWSWLAEPKYEIKSTWEWIKWPLTSTRQFDTSNNAALDAIRSIDEKVLF